MTWRMQGLCLILDMAEFASPSLIVFVCLFVSNHSFCFLVTSVKNKHQSSSLRVVWRCGTDIESQGHESYLDAGQVQVHDTGHVETHAQHEQQQHNHSPEKSRERGRMRGASRRINPIRSYKRAYVLWNHQQIDKAKEHSQDQGQHHCTGEVVVVRLVVLGGKKRNHL